jgi:hypothetical protein
MKQLWLKSLSLKLMLLLVLIALFLMNVSLILAQTGGGYSVARWTLGGSASSGAGYTLTGYVNQAEPGPALTGSGYTLVGGFWSGMATGSQQPVFLPLILHN